MFGFLFVEEGRALRIRSAWISDLHLGQIIVGSVIYMLLNFA